MGYHGTHSDLDAVFLQTADGRRTDNLCVQAKFVLDFILPLLAKMWQAYYRETINFVAVE